MADAATTPVVETSSTPTAPVVAATAATAAETTSTTNQPSTTTAEVSPKPVAATEATQEAKPTPEPEAAKPLFTIPEDMKLAPEATTKFEGFLKGKLQADGKVLLTSQEVLDQFVEQARDANTRWQQSIVDTNKANEAICKARFTPAQLAESETAVGFFSSYDPEFRDFAKSQLNSPIFVNAMRLVGERLSEDTFERAGTQPATAPVKSRAERMGYAKPKPN